MINANVKQQKSMTVRKMARIGVLGAISVVLSITPLGYIPINPVVQVTLMHIPVIIAGIVEGYLGGILVGLIFGITSLVRSLSGPLGPIFMNPIVSVAPRILIGVVAAFLYKRTRNVPLAAAIGTLTNTVGVLSMMYVFGAKVFAGVKNIALPAVGKAILGIGITNGIPEIIVAVIIITAVMKGIEKVTR